MRIDYISRYTVGSGRGARGILQNPRRHAKRSAATVRVWAVGARAGVLLCRTRDKSRAKAEEQCRLALGVSEAAWKRAKERYAKREARDRARALRARTKRHVVRRVRIAAAMVKKGAHLHLSLFGTTRNRKALQALLRQLRKLLTAEGFKSLRRRRSRSRLMR